MMRARRDCPRAGHTRARSEATHPGWRRPRMRIVGTVRWSSRCGPAMRRAVRWPTDMTERNPALEPFDAPIGTWATEATHRLFDAVVPGGVTFEWLEGGPLSRLLWEIAAEAGEVVMLRARLGVDSGQMSRMLRGLGAMGLSA